MTREEALSNVRSFIGQLTEDCQESIRELIPELKESEDERIRKELLKEIEFISPRDGETDGEGLILPSYHARIDRYKSYLEKQKEQKSLICDGEIEDRKRDIVAAIRKYYPADYAEYLTSFLKGLSPEDNSEDEYGQEMLGIAYKLMYEHIPENLRTQEYWDSLKFMREYTGKVAIIHSYEQQPAEWNDTDMKEVINDLISLCRDWECGKKTTLLPIVAIRARYFLEHLTEPKPAEWSEEDEKMIDKCIELVFFAMPANISAMKTKEQCLTWLKSLRPQPHWKPSEEQMAALNEAINEAADSGSIHLNSWRYNLLKEIKEKIK